jgi:hypothetical protein
LAAGPCFDFSKRVEVPLRPTVALGAGGAEVGDSGKEKAFVWARLHGVVKRPIEKVLAFLSDPQNMRDPELAELVVTPAATGPFLAHYTAHSLVKPFPFVRVEWTDEWAFTLLDGTAARPATVLVAYQKVEGTSHIAHYCGSLVLKRVDDGTTDVAQAEEANITGKNLGDEVKGLADFLVVLRTRP